MVNVLLGFVCLTHVNCFGCESVKPRLFWGILEDCNFAPMFENNRIGVLLLRPDVFGEYCSNATLLIFKM
jgi:hypothetical protein